MSHLLGVRRLLSVDIGHLPDGLTYWPELALSTGENSGIFDYITRERKGLAYFSSN